MKVKLHFFAQLKELIQEPELILESASPISCREASFYLGRQYPGLIPILNQCALARNGILAREDSILEDGDELALLPPVSGG